MSYLKEYLIIGSILYAYSMELWYRECHARCEFYNPSQLSFKLGFLLTVTLWPVLFPLKVIEHIKIMKKHR